MTTANGRYMQPFGYSYDFRRCAEGYKSYSVPLGYGQWHMVLVAKKQGMMPCLSEESMWQELNSTRYTTPLLREWSKTIYEFVTERSHIAMSSVRNFGCKCARMKLTQEQLDQMVIGMLKRGMIQIRGCSNLNTLTARGAEHGD